MAGASWSNSLGMPSMLVHVTHIDDSIRGRQGPCVYFWGITHDRSLYLLLEKYLECIRHYLEKSPPPLNLNLLDRVCCVLINHQWHRARVPQPKLSQTGTIEVICIDSGDTHAVPLAFVRTLDIPGIEAEHVREWPPLATKFILADMVAPRGPGSRSHWSEPAMMFLKVNVENRTWKAAPMGMYGEHQGVRLFDSNNQLLATLMIQQGLGVAAQTYHEAVSMCETMDKQPAFMKPAFNAFPAGGSVTNIDNTLPPSFAIPATYREHQPAFSMAANRSPEPPTAAPIFPRTFVTNDIPGHGRHDVVVTHIPDGPHKFYVQLKSEASDFKRLCHKLDSVVPHAFQGIPKLGTTCIAMSPSEKRFHRGLITAVDDYGNQDTFTIYFADIGTQEPVSIGFIFEIPDDLLIPRLFAYRVSLFGVEEIASLICLNEVFASFVNSAPNLQVEVMEDAENKQKVNLYDNTGRSIREVLASILASWMQPTTNVIPAFPLYSPTKFDKTAPACVTEIPRAWLASEEKLYVILAQEQGYFFGQLEKIPVKDLDDMASELMLAYSSDSNPPLLYADAKSHLGHYGVVQWDEDDNFYRIRVTEEFVNDAKVLFVDFGYCQKIPRCKIFAPLENLTYFRKSPFGIRCKIDDVTLSLADWSKLMFEKRIRVKIGKCVDEVYSVTLTGDQRNNEIAKAISSMTSPKCTSIPEKSIRDDTVAVENVPEPTTISNHDRLKRSNDNGNFGKSHYVHPNAKDSNWRTGGAEDATQSGQGKASSKDCNWRSSSNQAQEVIRNPRGPPPSTGNGEVKGPLGFQRHGQVEKSPSPLVQPAVKISPPSKMPELPKTRPISAVQKQYTYSQQALPGADSQVEVSCVVDPTSFYVQLSDNCIVLAELVEKLNEVYLDESKPLIADAKPDSACVVQYEEDNRWYRGRILQFNDPPLTIQLATVLFVDYGNTQQSSLKQLKAIDEEFVKLPPQAYHCRLNAIGNSRTWTIEDKNTLEARTVGKCITATFAELGSDGKFPVRLVDGSNMDVINEVFGAPSTTVVPPPSAGYTYLPVSQTPLDVSIAWYYNPGRIFTSPVDVSAYQNELDKLEEFYSSLSPDELLENQACVGLPCVARFTEDGRFYRSKILTIVDQVAKVLFVDYGNEQETPISQLRRMVPRFMQCPQLTWHSRLKGVKKMTFGPANPDPQKHISACFLTGQTLSALFQSTTPDGNNGVFEVELNVPEIGDAAKYLIEQRVLDRISLDTEIKLAPQNLNFVPEQIISTTAVAPFAKSVSEFWIQIQPETVTSIMERIERLTQDPNFANKKEFIVSIGKPCLAFYADDGQWYRAIVEAVDGVSAQVYYVDYGNRCIVNTNDLRELPQEFAQQPALAFKCCLDGVDVLTGSASDAFVSSITNLDSFTVKYLNAIDAVLNVRIYAADGSDFNEFLTKSSIPEVTVEESVQTSMHVLPSIPEEHPIQDLPEQLPSETVSQEPTKINYVNVSVSFASSPNQFFVQMKENDAKLVEMSNQIAEMYDADDDSFRITDQPIVDQIYGTTHPSFSGWYRSQIKAVYEDTVEAHFIDYGDTHTIQMGNIRSLPQQFADIPAMAFPGNWKIECSQAVAEKFTALCYEPEKTHWVVLGIDENGQQFIDSLFIGDENILDLLATDIAQSAPGKCETVNVDVGLSTIPEALLEQSSRSTVEDDVSKIISSTGDSSFFLTYGESSYTSPATAEDNASKIISSTGDSSDVFVPCEELSSICPSTLDADETLEESKAEATIEELPLLPVIYFAPGQKMSSYALSSYIESATEIWIQLDPAAVDSLMAKIAEMDVSQLEILDPQLQASCLALFPDDGIWYRALINSIDADQVKVTYIDYGNSSLVNVRDLRVLPALLTQPSGLALKCALDGTQQNLISSPTADQCESIIAQEVLTVVFASQSSEHLYVRLFDPSGLDLNEKLGLPESFRIESVASNLLEFNTLDDVEMSSPVARIADPAPLFDIDEDVTLPLEVEVVRGVTVEPLVAIPTVLEHSENGEAAEMVVNQIGQDVIKENEFYQCFSDSVNSFVREAILEPHGLEAKEVSEQLAILEEEVTTANITNQLLQETETLVPGVEYLTNNFDVPEQNATGDSNFSDRNEVDEDLNVPELNEDVNVSEINVTEDVAEQNVSEDLNVTDQKVGEDVNVTDQKVGEDLNVPDEKVTEDLKISEENFTEELNVSKHDEVCNQSKQKFDDDVFINVVNHLTAAPSSTMPSSLIEGTRFEDPLVILPLETSQVIEPEEVLEKLDVPVQQEDARKIADALYDERVALQIKTEMKSNEGERPKGTVYVSHIVSPGDFWIQHIEDELNIGAVEDGLLEVGTSNQYLLSGPPIVGQLYAAKHPEFGHWYRAKLLKLDRGIAEVIFFDYGDKQNLPLDWIRRLPLKDQCIPPMAVRCKLSVVDLDVWPVKATEVMRTLCPPEYLCRIVFKNETDPIFEVDSIYIGDIDVVEAILSRLECEHQVGASPQTIPQPLSPPQSQSSLTGVPQVDAQLFFIRADPEAESTKANQELNEDENRLPVD